MDWERLVIAPYHHQSSQTNVLLLGDYSITTHYGQRRRSRMASRRFSIPARRPPMRSNQHSRPDIPTLVMDHWRSPELIHTSWY